MIGPSGTFQSPNSCNDQTGTRKRGPLSHCAANKEGDCSHPDCPQIRDGEPAKTGRNCPVPDYEYD